ncbi:MAG TPA: hypothetical protein VJ843_03485 [Candidatus Saccharimonadales bacterium]|nr:hypothetical protein [Candidatus Saccharimonadales bacterium]
MQPEIEGSERSASAKNPKLPRYDLIRSWPQSIISAGAVVLLALYMAVVGLTSFEALKRVLTCATPIDASTDVYGDSYYNYGYRYDDIGNSKVCVPANLHASWVPASLAALSMTALAVLALILVGYLLHMTYQYVYNLQNAPVTPSDDDRRLWGSATRSLFVIPDFVKVATKGLTGAGGIFMLAAVTFYCVIYLVALG